MKLKAGISTKSLLDGIVIIQDDNLIKFNSTGQLIIKYIMDGLSEEGIASMIADEFDISPEDAGQHVRNFICDLESQGIIEI